jgi:hypothetical protein
VVKVSPTISSVIDLFTPDNQPNLDQHDTDFGSGGVLVLPDQPGPKPHLAVAAGKFGTMYLMDVDHLNGFNTTKNEVLGSYNAGPSWCGESYFVDADGAARIVTGGDNRVKVWKLSTSPKPSFSMVAQSNEYPSGQDPGVFTSVSSNGTSNTLVWMVSRPESASKPDIYLRAFNPDSSSPMAALFWTVAGEWPHISGNANLVPVVADGKVFVASYKQLRIFGLLPSGKKKQGK